MSKIFFDTNILVCALDRNSPEKQEQCRALLKYTVHEGTCVISTQVMQELYVAATKKLGGRPPPYKRYPPLFWTA